MSEAPSLPPGANAEDEGQRAGAAVKPSGQSAKQLKDVDALRAKTEAGTKEGAEIAFAKAANVGGDRHNSSRRVTPLAPVNGFYDQRHVCETASAAALKFESELERLFPDEVAADGSKAKLRKSSVVRVPRSVYSAVPGRNKFRPSQVTPIDNFVLAGDWTSQKFLGSMEGAVLAGKLAAEVIADRAAGRAAATSQTL